jgi:uncharacterized protein DUF1549/uncharacterized protein DUF1553
MRTPIRVLLASIALSAAWVLTADALQLGRNPINLSAEIDRIINDRLAEATIPTSPLADDSEFLRRAFLDIIGRIPSAERTTAFLKDTDPNKRRKLIDELLADHEYGEHFGLIWYHQIVKPDDDNKGLISPVFADWLAASFNKNYGWNKIVSDMLTAEGARDKNPATVFWFANVGADKDKNPEPSKITGAVSRLFMGVRLECCECHNHPFATLKQTDFWGTAAFFGHVHSSNASKKDVKAGATPSIREGGAVGKMKGNKDEKSAPFDSIVIPDTKGQTVKARFLLGTEPNLNGRPQLRPTFAAWATSANNPYFAKAMVNRMWAHFFGRGLVTPLDDMRPENKCTHPELLDALAKEFAGSNFDLKHLIRCIANSQAYQRTSVPRSDNKSDEELYSHGTVRMMTADMLYDSLQVALSHAPADNSTDKAKGAKKGGGGGPRAQFRKFFHTEADDDASAVADYAHGIPQVLRMMNSTQMNNTAAVIAKLMKTDSTPERVVESIYLRILSRMPTPTESQKMVGYVAGSSDPAKGYNDVMWALLNSSEFLFNH